ncbi:MAG TPA: DUF896 domain-containing protein [Firmicutes bacterium]|nr:DUF896 domain-containing protein [Bacillota bacterium]
MEQKKIDRISQLSRKQRTVGLTKEEKLEQAQLRQEYLQTIRENIKATLDRAYVVEKDGAVKKLRQ